MNVFRLKSSSNSTATKGSESKASSISEGLPVTHEPILTPPTDYSPVLPAALDEAQQATFEKLKTYIHSIMLPEDHEYYPSEKGFVTDVTLKRYLRARKWDYEVCNHKKRGGIFFYVLLLEEKRKRAGKCGEFFSL